MKRRLPLDRGTAFELNCHGTVEAPEDPADMAI